MRAIRAGVSYSPIGQRATLPTRLFAQSPRVDRFLLIELEVTQLGPLILAGNRTSLASTTGRFGGHVA